MKKAPDPAATRAAVLEVADYITGATATTPPRTALAQAVRLTARTLEHTAEGHSVEVRVPPFVAVQCIPGPRHTRGTPPNVVQLPPRAWLQLACGQVRLDDLVGQPGVEVSGTRAHEIAEHLPIVPLPSSSR